MNQDALCCRVNIDSSYEEASIYIVLTHSLLYQGYRRCMFVPMIMIRTVVSLFRWLEDKFAKDLYVKNKKVERCSHKKEG